MYFKSKKNYAFFPKIMKLA